MGHLHQVRTAQPQKTSNHEQLVLDTKTITDPPKSITDVVPTFRIDMPSIVQSPRINLIYQHLRRSSRCGSVPSAFGWRQPVSQTSTGVKRSRTQRCRGSSAGSPEISPR